MADMNANQTGEGFLVNLVAGERIRIQILNSDGTEKTLLCDVSVPAGKTLTGSTSYAGVLS